MLLVGWSRTFYNRILTLLKTLTAAGMSWTQWRQEKDVIQEKLDRLEDRKVSGLVTSSWWKERPGLVTAWW